MAVEAVRGWVAGVLAALLLAGAAPADDAQGNAPLAQHTLTGDWQGVRPLLSGHGFSPYLTYTGLFWGNVHGGAATGARVNGFLNAGVDIDLHDLGLWAGLGVHGDVHWFQGPQTTRELVGGNAAMTLSGWEASDAFRLYNLYLRQTVAGDRYVLKAGQLAADTDFMISRYGGLFLNAAFGDLPSQNLNLDAPVYPLAAPGVYAKAQPLAWLTGRFGAYTGDPGRDTAGNHGLQWKLGNNAGYVLFLEAAVSAPQAWLPATYTLGAIYGSGGSAQQASGFPDVDTYELYAMADQALIADANGDPLLAAFARLTGSPQQDRNAVWIYADTGLAWFGPLPARRGDVLGLAVSLLRWTAAYRDQTRAARMPVGDGESLLELTYQIAVTPWLVIQPDAQFFFNPSSSRRDAQVLGGELAVVF